MWPWAIAVLLLALLACLGGSTFYMCAPYEEGPRHQIWTVTITHGGRTGTSRGFGLGRCGEEGTNGASATKSAAAARACFAAGLCSGNTVCDCGSRARPAYRCEEGQTPGRTRAGDLITIPVH